MTQREAIKEAQRRMEAGEVDNAVVVRGDNGQYTVRDKQPAGPAVGEGSWGDGKG